MRSVLNLLFYINHFCTCKYICRPINKSTGNSAPVLFETLSISIVRFLVWSQPVAKDLCWRGRELDLLTNSACRLHIYNPLIFRWGTILRLTTSISLRAENAWNNMGSKLPIERFPLNGCWTKTPLRGFPTGYTTTIVHCFEPLCLPEL